MRIKRGQVSMEQTMLIVILIGALVTISTYFKRALQSRWKDALDDVGEQYDPDSQETLLNYYYDANTYTIIETQDATDGGYWTKRFDFSNVIDGKKGSTKVMGGAWESYTKDSSTPPSSTPPSSNPVPNGGPPPGPIHPEQCATCCAAGVGGCPGCGCGPS